MEKWHFEIIFRSFILIFGGMQYYVYRCFMMWIKSYNLSSVKERKIRFAYLFLGIFLSMPWLGIAIYGSHFTLLYNGLIKALYILPCYIWQFSHIVLFFILIIYKTVKLAIKPISYIYKRVSKPVAFNNLKRSWFKRSVVVLPASIFTLNFVGAYNSEYDFVINKVNIKINNLPDNLKGLSITHISDLHFGIFLNEDKFDKYIPEINRLGSQIIVVTGDIINNSLKAVPMAIRSLTSLKAPFGIYACMGNHDYIVNTVKFLRAFKNTGIDILIDDSRSIKIYDEKLYIMGMDYPRNKMSFNKDKVKHHLGAILNNVHHDEHTKILLAHHPTSFFESSKYFDLTLSGHTHGGQFIFGEIGNIKVAPAQLGFPYLKGHYMNNGNHLYVNSGLGHWLPIRVNCPPEITVLILE